MHTDCAATNWAMASSSKQDRGSPCQPAAASERHTLRMQFNRVCSGKPCVCYTGWQLIARVCQKRHTGAIGPDSTKAFNRECASFYHLSGHLSPGFRGYVRSRVCGRGCMRSSSNRLDGAGRRPAWLLVVCLQVAAGLLSCRSQLYMPAVSWQHRQQSLTGRKVGRRNHGCIWQALEASKLPLELQKCPKRR